MGATEAAAHFAGRLAFETDPFDVAAAQQAGEPLLLIDVRSDGGWRRGHLPGAVHLTVAELADADLPPVEDDPQIVVYGWGPACNAGTKAALALSLRGYPSVREMIGGFEYWVREGLLVQWPDGAARRPVDELTTG